MASDIFESRYIGSFPEDPILKALKKAYISVADKDRQFFLPQSIIKQGIDAIRHGADPGNALVGVLESIGKLLNEMHRQSLIRAQLEVRPIVMTRREHGE